MSSRQRYLMSSTDFVILRRESDICVLRRANTGWMDGHFSLPAGGVEEHETLLEATVREAREEVGVQLDPRDLRLVHTLHCRMVGEAWTGHFFVADAWWGEPALLELDKHADQRWVRLDALAGPFVPYVQHALLPFARGETYSEYGWVDHREPAPA